MSLNTGNAILSNAITVDGSYNVGIGGAAEAGWILKSTGNTKVSSSSGTTVLQVNDTSTGGKAWSLISAGAGNAHSVAAGTFYLRNSSDGSNALTIASTGAATFSSSVTTGSFTNSTYFKVANSNGISGYLIPQATWLGTGTATNLLIAAETGNSIGFMTNGTTDFRMFINTSGNVGIGTTSPAVKLDILTTTSSSADATGIRLLNNNGENVGNIDFDNLFGNLARITGTKMGGVL